MDTLIDLLADYGFNERPADLLQLGISLLVGGALSLYVRFLYNRFSAGATFSSPLGNVFPLLTLVTICVIAVVKTSLALSLGLVGALSIVRFRAAIKQPEELVYLFFCIAIGLGLGAGQLLFTLALVIAASLFIIGRRLIGGGRRHNFVVSISGGGQEAFDQEKGSVFQTLEELAADRYTVQRYDITDQHRSLRLHLERIDPKDAASLMNKFKERLPACDISFLNLDTLA